MDLNLILIYMIGGVVVVALLRYIMAAQAVLGMNLESPALKRVERDQCPEHIREFFAQKEKELDDLGFDYLFCFTSETSGLKMGDLKHVFVYYHQVEKTYAALMISPDADDLIPFSVEFATHFTDGEKYSTANGIAHTLVSDIPGAMIQDLYTDDLDKQWAHHVNVLEQMEDKEIKVFPETPEGFDAMLEENRAFSKGYYQNLLRTGKVYEVEDGIYLLKTFPALSFARKFLSGLSRIAQMRRRVMMRRIEKQRAGHAVDAYNIPPRVEAEYFMVSNRAMKPKHRNSAGSVVILIFTAAMFLAAFSFLFDFRAAVILLIVIGIHEAGHLAAMAICGYKDLKMLFVPLFGAVAMGSGKRVKAYKKVITFFAGPLPGILIGFGLFVLYKNAMLPDFLFPYAIPAIVILLVINYFNLLPIMPLDGGQIMNTVIFSRYSVLQFVFFIFSVAALGLLGLYLKEPLLLILAAVTPLSYKGHFVKRNLTVLMEERLKHRPEVTDLELAEAVFAELKGPAYSKYSFARKIVLVRYVEEYFREPKASAATVIATLIVYAVVFVIPIVYYILPRLSGPGGFMYGSSGPCAIVKEYSPGKTGAAVKAGRFERLAPAPGEKPTFTCFRYCFFSKDDDIELMSPPAFLSRAWGVYGEPDKTLNGFSYRFKDTVTGEVFTAYCESLIMLYGGDADKIPKIVPVLHQFEQFLGQNKPVEFEYTFTLDFTRMKGNVVDKEEYKKHPERYKYIYKIGNKSGVPYMYPMDPAEMKESISN